MSRFKLDLPVRPRRLRRTEALRDLVRATSLDLRHLVAPLFVVDGDGGPVDVASMPGVRRLPVPDLVREAARLASLGVRAVAVFPVLEPARKDRDGTGALDPDGLLLRAVRALKREIPDLTVVTDVALDPYTTHGHDGLVDDAGTRVLNDATVEVLARMAVLQAGSGVDLVAPSDMMDGRVGAIRRALDAAGFEDTGILAYSAKFASAYYGPFRDAVGSASAAGTRALDKRTYQMDPANAREAVREALLDEAEGADIVMVKPAGPYLDIVRAVREAVRVPVAAYQVSGEFAQIHAAARAGWLDLRRCRDESLLAIRRAGADLILTYFTAGIAAEMREQV